MVRRGTLWGSARALSSQLSWLILDAKNITVHKWWYLCLQCLCVISLYVNLYLSMYVYIYIWINMIYYCLSSWQVTTATALTDINTLWSRWSYSPSERLWKYPFLEQNKPPHNEPWENDISFGDPHTWPTWNKFWHLCLAFCWMRIPVSKGSMANI